MHWHVRVGDPKLIDTDAAPAQLAGAWWAAVSSHRAAASQALTLPDVGRIIGSLKQLSATRTQPQLVSLMRTIVANWPAIASALSWMVPAPVLDETTLSRRHVIELAEQIAAGQPVAPRPTPRSNVATAHNSYEDPDKFRRELLASLAEDER